MTSIQASSSTTHQIEHELANKIWDTVFHGRDWIGCQINQITFTQCKKKHVASSATARGDDLGGWSGLPPASSGVGTKVEKSSGWIKSYDCPSIWRDLAIRNHGLIHMLRGFYHQQWWFDEEFHEGSMMVIPYVYSNHSNIYIYIYVYWGGEEPPWTQSILVWEGYGGELTHGNSGDSAGCLGYPYSLSALICRVETSRLDIMCIYITWHNMFTICNMDIVYIYIYTYHVGSWGQTFLTTHTASPFHIHGETQVTLGLSSRKLASRSGKSP